MPKLPVPKSSVVFKELPDGAVLYCGESEVYFGVNEVGVAIWSSLPPVLHTFDELLSLLTDRFPDAPVETISSDAREFVDQLVENGLAVP